MNNDLKGPCVGMDPETGASCGKPGKPKLVISYALLLCPDHYTETHTWKQKVAGAVVARMDKDGILNGHSPGWTYVVRLDDGNIKIGMTRATLLRRLKDIGRDYNAGNPVEVLAVLEGGDSRELLLHKQWSHLRVISALGERFRPEPELMAWIAEQEVAPSAKVDVEDFNTYRTWKLNLLAINQVAQATITDNNDW